jgi:hypothetical protein
MHAVPHAAPPFIARVERVTAADLPYSWHRGCPVPPSALRRIRLAYWGFDGRRHLGELVVRDRVTGDVVKVFRILYGVRFPIRRLEPVDRYRGSDDASMAADNTSGFNCRAAAAPGAKRWSEHAYGEAIDVNPVENPYLEGGRVLPPAGRAFVDRTPRPGMALLGGVLVNAFAAVAWRWGGTWTGARDYQHFSRSGR